MPAEATFKIEGLDDLNRNLQTFGWRVYRNTMKRAIRAAARPVVKAARAGAPVRTGALKKSINVRIKAYPRSETVVAVIGARTDVAASGHAVVRRAKGTSKASFREAMRGKHKPYKIIRLVERGHKGKKPASPHPFLEPALRSQRSASISALKRKLSEGIAKEAART